MRAARLWGVGLLCVGCRVDPELQQARRSLQAWDASQTTPSREAKMGALQKAIDIDPGSVALRRSMARRLGAAGGYLEAIAMLNAVIPPEPTPTHAPAVWDRAALHARSGDLAAAAADVQTSIRLGVDPRALAADAAFGVLVADPAYAGLLPAPELRLQHRPAAEKVLLGEPWRRQVTVHSPDQNIALTPLGPPPPGLVLTEVVEDRLEVDAYHSVRELRLEWRAILPGVQRLPAIQVGSGPHMATLPAAEVEAVQLGGSAPAAPARTLVGLPVPSHYDLDEAPGSDPILSLGGYVVQAPAHWSCTLRPAPAGAVRLIRREGGQPRWSGWWVPEGSDARWSCEENGISQQLR